jgi:ketoreductase RED2
MTAAPSGTEMAGDVVIVTGSTSGIGEAVARRLAGLGAHVVVNSARSNEAGQRIAAELGDAIYVQGDIGDPATAAALVDGALERWGRLDGVVNNAAMTVPVALVDFEQLDVDHWERVLRVNVIGTFLVTRAALPALRASGHGWIVNITSVGGLRQMASSMPYAASKAAVNHMTKIMARFVGPDVRVNAVAPGLIETPWTAVPSFDAMRERFLEVAPLRRTGTADDVAAACLGVIQSPYTTGQVFTVDGGINLVL